MSFCIGKIFREVTIVTGSSSFIRCRFEECEQTDAGTLVSSGDNVLLVESTFFYKCSSKTKCGGLKKTDGSLLMKCCEFDECHGVNGDTRTLGTAMGTSDCSVKFDDIVFLNCWKQESPYADNVYGILRGKADTKNINSTQCISLKGGLAGSYDTVEEKASIRYIQCVQSSDNNAIEVRNVEQIVHYFNIINNTIKSEFIYINKAKLTVHNGCFFSNTLYNDVGTVELFDCISDGHPKATKTVEQSSIPFTDRHCRLSRVFTKRGDQIASRIFTIWLLLG